MMRAITVDDEPLARRGIQQLLADHSDVEIVAECANGTEAIAAIGEHAPDLVFLDVQMPEVDGFEVVRCVGADRMPAVVFVTAYEEFAVRAFEASAVDYLMKPVGPERFARAMQHVRERQSGDAAARRIADLQSLLATLKPAMLPHEPPLVVPTARGMLRIDPLEIDWISADDYYAVLHIGTKRYLLRESLASLETRLPAGRFVRVHRSTIVNCTRVRELRNRVVILNDGTRVATSRRRRPAVDAALRVAIPLHGGVRST